MNIDFVKGHCGWDTVTLVPTGQIPSAQELEAALKILSPPISGGLEMGFLERTKGQNEIRLRIVASTQKDWIPMCGGMTQVLGKALIETQFRDYFSINIDSTLVQVRLITPSSVVPIEISLKKNRTVESVRSVMDEYCSYLYDTGVEPLSFLGVDLLRVGDFAVIDILSLESQYPDEDFTRRDLGSHLDIVNELLGEFEKHRDLRGVYGMLFDHRATQSGRFRIFSRFVSDDMVAADIPYEFQCGTGTIAVGVALAHLGLLPFEDSGSLLFEWGNPSVTHDPYGIRTTQLDIRLDGQTITHSSFMHSVVELNAEGTLMLPNYQRSPATSFGTPHSE